jgi:amino acid transporter/mannitol/fructose-specific phosphotransferase system IIA component (Ntr-type)
MSVAQEPVESRLRKELGLFDVYAISTGAMFSSGFFLLPGLAAAQTGPSVALAYLVAGLFILPAMFAVAELATAMPRAGGAYYFLDRALGPLVGTVGGLGTWVALVLKSAFALVGMGAYLALYVDVPIQPLAVALTVVFTVVNVVGAKESSGLQRFLVTILLGILFFFILQGLVEVASLGFGEVTAERFTPLFAFGFGGFMATVGFVFVSYAGLTKVASVSEEVRNPDRNIPLGMILSLATAAFVYAVGVYILVAVLPPEELRSDLTPVATAAAAFFDWLPGGAGVVLVVVAAIAAFASTGNAGILSASRYPLAMARDKLVSPGFSRLGRFQTPTNAIVATAGLMIAAILLLDVEGIAKLASAFQLLLFSLLSLAVIIMRESRIDGYDPGFRSPLYPWMQIFGVLAPFWLITEMGEMAVLFTLGMIGLTIGWYFHYAAPRVERAGAIFHAFHRLGRLRHRGLEGELRGILQEKGLRDEDPFQEMVARAEILEYARRVPLRELMASAAARLGGGTDLPVGELALRFAREMRAGFVPMGQGTAIPHLRVPDLPRPRLVLVRCRDGIYDPSGEGGGSLEVLRAVFFLLSPEEQPGLHLRLLGHLATHVDDPEFMDRWLQAGDPVELRSTLLRDERILSVTVGASPATSEWIGLPLRRAGIPPGTLVAVVRRGGRDLVPNGSTVLESEDELTLLGDPEPIRAAARELHPTDARPAVTRS